MKKAIAIILVIVLMTATMTVLASANEYKWGFAQVGGTQGIDGWWYMYSRAQSNTGARFNPTGAAEMEYYEYVAWCGPTWGVPESAGPADTSVYSIWTDIGSIWKQYYPDGNTDPWGRLSPSGLDAVVILKWIPPQSGTYNLNVIIDQGGLPGDKEDEAANGSVFYVNKNHEILYQKDFAPAEKVSNLTAFNGEVVLDTIEALYFSLDPKVSGASWDNTYDEDVFLSITITRTGDVPAGYVANLGGSAAVTGANEFVVAALVMLVISSIGAVIVVKRVKA